MIKRIGWVFLGLTALLSLFWHWLHSAANVRVNAERWKRYPLQVHFIDVGHGDSILVICEGRAMLVDAGMPFWSKTVRKYMRLCGVESLDYLICRRSKRARTSLCGWFLSVPAVEITAYCGLTACRNDSPEDEEEP